MRIVFAGTPDVAVPSLRLLLESSRHEVVGVITNPDARTGRGRKFSPSPVAECAADAGIPVLKPSSASDTYFISELRQLHPDCCPIVAYGKILPPALLDVPLYGWVNLHFSLLPAWRGAAPVQRAIAAGDALTGASTFLLEPGMDTGPVFASLVEPISSTDTAGSLLHRLSISGAKLLIETLDAIDSGEARPLPQSEDNISYADKITVDDARIRWDVPSHIVSRQIRSVTPFPGAWSTLNDERFKVLELSELSDNLTTASSSESIRPGELRFCGKKLLVGTADSPLHLHRVQAAGKRAMDAADWARGAHLTGDEVLK